MKRLLACLALCASLSASAQDDNCTILGVQELLVQVLEMNAQIQGQGRVLDLFVEMADWGNIDLVGRDLRGARLRNANFQDINFSDAILIGVDFSNSNIRADFYDADMTDAILTNCYVGNGNLRANLTGADLAGVDLSIADLHNATLVCLRNGCPSAVPAGYVCEPDPDCSEPDRYRIVPE